MNDDDQLEQWLAQWDKMSQELAKETTAPEQKPQARTSFFTNSPAHADYVDDLCIDNDSLELYQRSMTIDADVEPMLNESDMNAGDDKRDGFGDMVRGDKQITKGDVSYTQNPQNPHAIGPDGAKDGGPIRVTKNWSSGVELEEVDQLKHEIEAMERECHKADVLNNKSQRDKLTKQLESLRAKVNDLSEKMQPRVEKDVT